MIVTATGRGGVIAAIGVLALAGCLQSASSPCDTGGVCIEGLRCGMAGEVQVCVPGSCGNGQLDPGEACDDGNNVSGDGCPADCSKPCGDRILDPGERCDDGNAIDGDGCDTNCTFTACGNRVVDPGEVCDDGNAIDGDGCDSNCTITACGNGVVDPSEACDDGNATDGDGCDHDCRPSCFPEEPTFEYTPANGTEAPAGVPFVVDIAITNHNPAPCAPVHFSFQYDFFSHRGGARFTVDPPPFAWHGVTVPSGTTGHLAVTVTSEAETYPSTAFDLHFSSLEGFGASKSFVVGEPPGCHVSLARELLIKSLPVINDPIRTKFEPSSSDPRNGVWTFKHLMEAAAPTLADAPAMVETMMRSFLEPQVINGFVVEARPAAHFVLDGWPRTADGKLDLARAPLTLQAIVNRFDLRDPAGGDAGELEFEFAFRQVLAGHAMLLFRYKVPATTAADVLVWAQAFHHLGSLSFGEDYNAPLQQLTEQVVGRGAWPGRTNGSALIEVQSYDTDFDFGREPGMRAFALAPTSGGLQPVLLDQTPDQSFNQTDALASFLRANRDAILAGRHTVPTLLDGQPFQGGGAALPWSFWSAPGVDNDVRFQFAMHTCQGCHGGELGGTNFLSEHISPQRSFDEEPDIGGYLVGATYEDPVTSEPRHFNELYRRAMDLKPLVCDPM